MDPEEDLARGLMLLDALHLVAMRLTGHLGHGYCCGCTEWQAAWCPIHGDCVCNTSLELPAGADCNLHGVVSESPFRQPTPAPLPKPKPRGDVNVKELSGGWIEVTNPRPPAGHSVGFASADWHNAEPVHDTSFDVQAFWDEIGKLD